MTWLVHAGFVLVLPPFLLGVIARVKAVFAGRRGPPLLQPYFDLYRLVHKELVISETATPVFYAGPVVALVSVLAAALLVPLGLPDAPVSFDGDLVLFAYLLALGRLFTVLAALDTGSSFEGMGAAREAAFAGLAEPALFLGLLTVVKLSGTLSLSTMFDTSGGAPLALVAAGLFGVLLAENSRIPFDDPNTHLELTMIHEVMVLDHSGPLLALVLYGAAIKLTLFAALIVHLVLPAAFGALGFLVGLVGVAVLVGIAESVTARVQLPKAPRLLIAAGLLSAFGLLLVAR